MSESPRSLAIELLEITTVGFPFCAFKVIAGFSFAGPAAPAAARAAGLFLVALGLADGILNAVNLAAVLLTGRRRTASCVFALAALALRRGGESPARWREFGDALDTLLAFVLVSVMIGGGRLVLLAPRRLASWNIGVILNVLGAGVGRFGLSVRDLSRERRGAA